MLKLVDKFPTKNGRMLMEKYTKMRTEVEIMSLGNNLLNMRKKAGLSQEEVAEKLNVSRQTVSKWETDASQPDFDKIKPLCELYNITADELLFEKKTEKKEETNLEETYVEEKDDELFHMIRRRKKAVLIGLGVFFYFLPIIAIMILIPVLQINPIVASSVFLGICGLATFIIVYANIFYKKNDVVTREQKFYKKNPILNCIYVIITLVYLCLYLLISFKTYAWNVTWMFWIVYSINLEVVKLIYLLVRGGKDEK